MGQKHHLDNFADIMQEAGNKQFLYFIMAQVVADDFGSDGASQRMIPKPFLILLHFPIPVGEQIKYGSRQK